MIFFFKPLVMECNRIKILRTCKLQIQLLTLSMRCMLLLLYTSIMPMQRTA